MCLVMWWQILNDQMKIITKGHFNNFFHKPARPPPRAARPPNFNPAASPIGPPTNPPTKAPATGKAAAFHLLAYKNT